MKRLFFAAMFLAGMAAAMLLGGSASAQNVPVPADAPANIPAGLTEIMILQQMRHIKLWFAGRAGNWPLADYELGELSDGFDDVNKLLGGDTVDDMVGAPIKALQKAIQDKNRAAFMTAFDSLNAGCNTCHHTLDHPFIVIQRPSVLPYSDQTFEPQKQNEPQKQKQ
jgi:hypothetical protein